MLTLVIVNEKYLTLDLSKEPNFALAALIPNLRAVMFVPHLMIADVLAKST